MSRQHETDLPPAGEVIPFPAPGRPVPAGGVTPVPPDRDAGPADETPVPSGTDLEPAVFEAEIVAEPAGPVWSRPLARRPVVAPWLADRQQRRDGTKYHGFRGPLYAARWVLWAPRGAGRVVAGVAGWCADTESAPLRAAAVSGKDGRTYAALRSAHDAAVQRRTVAVLAALAALGGLLAWWWLAGPAWAPDLTLLAAVGVLGWAGRPAGRPVLPPAVERSARVLRLTEPIVMRALAAAGLGGPKAARRPAAKDGEDQDQEEASIGAGRPKLVVPIARDGAGWLALVDLPYGIPATRAFGKRKELAAGLDVASVQLSLEARPESERRLLMWVADTDPFAGRPRSSPLARCPKVTVWQPQPLGLEPRGRVVRPALMFSSFLVGAVPRQGKTFTARLLVTPALLDPHCDVTVLDLKGGRDWRATEKLAVRYLSGDDDEDIATVLLVLEQLVGEARERFRRFRTLSDTECPESKLTPELAARGMRPHLVVVDEVQNALRHATYGKSVLPLLIWLAKTAPAAGFTLVLATQRPSADVIPADLRDNTTVRLALKTMDYRSSDTILGASANSIGIESHTLILHRHAGVAVVRGIDNARGGDHQTVRSDLLTGEDFTRVCQVGRQRRIDTGTLRGAAAGEPDPVAVQVSVVADVLAVWPGAEPKVWAETLCERLAEFRPTLYGQLDPTALTRALGLDSVQVFRDGTNKRGYALDAVQVKAAERPSSD